MKTSASSRSKLLVASILSFGLALMTAVSALTTRATVVGSSIVLAYATYLALLIVQVVMGRRWLASESHERSVWLHPPMMITLWVIVAFGVPGLYTLTRSDLLLDLEVQTTVDPTFTASGMLLIIVGCLCLWIAYGSGLQWWRSSRFLRDLARREPKLGTVMAFYALAVIVQIIQITVAGIAYGADTARWGALAPFQQWLGYVQDISLLVLALTALKVFGQQWPVWSLVIVVTVQTGFGFVSGFMKPIFWLSVILLLAALIVRVNLRRLILPAVLLVTLGVLVVPVAENLRTQRNTDWSISRNSSQVIDSTAQALTDTLWNGPVAAWQFTLDRMLTRQAEVAFTPALIIQKTPSLIPYQGIEYFLAIPAYIIPRAIWRDKPILSQGNQFSILYMNRPDFSTSSAAITIFGEGYMFAGWIGTVLSCLVLGFLLALVYQNTALVGLWPVYLALVPTFVDVEGQFTGIFVALVQRAVIFTAVYWLMVKMSDGQN